MKNPFALVVVLALMCCCVTAIAAPTDIVPRGSALLDAFATLAHGGAFQDYSVTDFYGDRQFSRAQLADLIGEVVQNGDTASRLSANAQTMEAWRFAINALQPELDAAGVVIEPSEGREKQGNSYAGYVGAEERVQTSGTINPKDSTLGNYRVTDILGLGTRTFAVASVSNWPQDYRQVIDREMASNGYSALNEAYVDYTNPNGATFDIGRMYERWGAAQSGATMISDNAPALDQVKVSFPFSLGALLGKNYRYTQFAGTFLEDGDRKYIEARRIEYAFSPALNAQFEESFKSSEAKGLAATPVPFLLYKGFDLGTSDNYYNYNSNFGLSYRASSNFTTYGQFYVDDITSPLRGHILGLDVGEASVTRKISYIAGGSYMTPKGTEATLEYAYADPEVDTFHNSNAIWENGYLNWLGLPGGGNMRQYYGRVAQKVQKRLTLSAEYRRRLRVNEIYPAPEAANATVSALYQIDRNNSFEASFIEYRQEPYPFAPDSPLLPVEVRAPSDEGNFGSLIHLNELDLKYTLAF